jgi:myo-inositol-1(or 4)-monophosphatase
MADSKLKHRINAGRVAVKKQIDFFHKQFAHGHNESKEDGNCIAFADFAISEKIFTELRKSFADDNYFSEESNSLDDLLELNARYSWILNPIDGTKNYALGIPACAIALNLLKDGYPVYAYVYDMLRQKMIEGSPRDGLIAGCRKTAAKPGSLGKHSRIGIEFPLSHEVCEQLEPLLTNYHLLDVGSSVLNSAYTAIGFFDGCLGFDVNAWNLSAAYTLCLAGGKEFHFIGDSVFPLKQINCDALDVKYFAGTPSFCAYMGDLCNISMITKEIPANAERVAR